MTVIHQPFEDLWDYHEIIELFQCSVCFEHFEYAFRPNCSYTTCRETWYCSDCVKRYWSNRKDKFFSECTHCIRKINSLIDTLGNQVDIQELYRRCSTLKKVKRNSQSHNISQ